MQRRSRTDRILTDEMLGIIRGYIPEDPLQLQPIPSGGSGRLFYRIRIKGASWVLMLNPEPQVDARGISENDSFFYIALHLRGKGAPVPEIYGYDLKRGWFLMEDFGDRHLQAKVIEVQGDHRLTLELYQQVIDLLIHIQIEGAKGFEQARTHNPPYDEGFILNWESGYFLRSFVRGYLGITTRFDELRDELVELAHRGVGTGSLYFLYRDYQSRNIMARPGGCGLLDFQGGRLGPLQYDIASLLLDPYVGLAPGVQEELLNYYIDKLAMLIPLDKGAFARQYPFVAIHRAMQILGAFGNLVHTKGLETFRQYIPQALSTLKRIIAGELFSPYKGLRKLILEELPNL